MALHLAFDKTDERLWAWISVNIIVFIYFILFVHIYFVGKYQYREQHAHSISQNTRKIMKLSNITSIAISTSSDYIIFERLRLLCCFMLLCYSLWPFQFYFSSSLTDFEHIFIVSLSSLADFGVTFIISVITHRTIKSYHKIVRGTQIPSCYNFILFMFVFINGFCSVCIEMLSYGMHSDKFKIFDTIYNYWAYVYLAFETILFITLFRFLIKIVIIFGKIYKYEKSRGIKSDAKEIAMKRLYQRMVYLCGGLSIYCFMLIGCYIYFFLAGGKDITNDFLWIIIHELCGHIVLYSTFYSYLRIKRHIRCRNNISGNKNIGAKLIVTRHRPSHTNSSSNPKFNNIYNHRIQVQHTHSKYSGVNKGKYYQMSNDDFFADDDQSDLRRIRRESQSDQTEIMSMSATDEARRHWDSYKESYTNTMMPQSVVPPVQFTISPNPNTLNSSNEIVDTKMDYNYTNFII